MAKNPRQPLATKKHLARIDRERRQTRLILLGSIAVIVLVLGLIAFGIFDQNFLRPRRAVAVVNGDRIGLDKFEAQTRYSRYSLVRNAESTYQFAQLFGSDPSTAGSFAQQLQQIQLQLDPVTSGQQVLDQMVDNLLIRQEAARRGITVTDEEVEKAFQEAFGFYPDGTPTPSPTLEPLPTSTLSPLQQTLVPPTSTPTATPPITATATVTATGTVTATAAVTATSTPVAATPAITPTAVLTPTATPAPTASPTPYTLEGYQSAYQETVKSFQDDYDISEADLRYVIESSLYREKVRDAILAEQEIGRTQEQAWARHILVEDEQAAQAVVERLNNGESFCALAAELSTDTSNKDNCGDLGWFPREGMVTEFSDAAFSLDVGEISAPVQTTFGYHIIQGLGHEDRPLSDDEIQQLEEAKFQEWLTQQKESSEIETQDFWQADPPTQPALSPEILDFIQQAMQVQQPQQPVLPQPTP